jgi:mevalonate kinase
MTTACAPGKIILLGEHAVVYGRPALAVPLRQVQACASIEPAASGPAGGILIAAPDRALRAWRHDLEDSHPLAAICASTLEALHIGDFPPILLTILSTIPVASGLGSSAAVSVAVARALNRHFAGALNDARISELAFEVERIHHGTPSGIDNTVVAFDRPIFFQRGQPAEPLTVGAACRFLIADTGTAAPTAEAVGRVRRRWEADPKALEAAFDEIARLVLEARQALLDGAAPRLGQAMQRNHGLLVDLGVSSRELDRLVEAAHDAGSLGAKMSGGGLGGHMIALVTPERQEAVARALQASGAAAILQTEVAP